MDRMTPYGCWNRQPFKPFYLSTGGTKPIPHAMTTECQYRILPGGRAAHIEQGRIWSAETRNQIETQGLWPENLPEWSEK